MNFYSNKMKNSLNNAIFIIVLLLCAHMIDGSRKLKTQSSINSRMKKAKIKVRSSTGIDCSATSIMGVNGTCVNMNPTGLNNYMPSDFSAAWKILGSVISAQIPAGPVMCFGDFNGGAFQTSEDLGSNLCNTIPVVSDGSFGVIGLSVSSIPCGVLTDVAMCVTFDKCGTFAIAFNGGVPACLTFYGGLYTGVVAGIGAAASAIADTVQNFSIGFSIGRQYSVDIRLAYRDGSKIHSGTVTTYGHIFADIGLGFPTDFMKIGTKDLSEYFSLTADILFLIDFGDVDTVASSAINTIKTMNLSNAKSLLSTIVKSGPELTLNASGVLTLNLYDLTEGVLCDFAFTLASASILLTGGSGRSGLEGGIYFRISSDFVSDLVNSLLGVFDNFSEVFEDLGFGGISVPKAGIELGFFLTKTAMGFQFTFVGFTVKCILVISGFKFSCAINAKIFSIIADALNYVIKEVAVFFSDSGRVIATKTKQAFKTASKAISENVKKGVGYVKNSSGALIAIGSDAFTDLKNEFEEDLKWIKNGYKNAAKRTTKVLSQVSNVAKKKAEIILCNTKYLLNKKKRKKCKNSVRSKYDNDSNSSTDSCPNYEYRYTSWVDDQDGKLIAPTFHTMDCSNYEFINYMRMERNGSNIRYRFKCVKVENSGACYYPSSAEFSPNTTSAYSNVDAWFGPSMVCKDGYGIKKIKHVYNSTTGKYRYDYSCCLAAVTGITVTCDSMQTTNEDMISNSSLNLDRLWVDAGEHRFLKSIKLNDIGDGQFNYTYESCTINDSVITQFDTGCNDEGSGSVYYLDRHEVTCDTGKALNYVRLRRDSYQIHYEYKCVNNKNSITSSCTTYYTTWNDIRSGKPKSSLNYLDRHNMKCPTGTVMSKFNFERSSSDKIRYAYDCCIATVTNCVTKTTGWTDGGDWEVYYLDRQTIDATGTKVFQQLSLDTDDGNVRYYYTACDLA